MGKFVIKSTNGKGVMFNLVADNHEVIATSQVYKSMRNLRIGIASIRRNCNAPIEDQTIEPLVAEKCPKYEVYKDKIGEFRFRLIASNGQTITSGEGYTTKANCLNGIDSIRRNAPEATVEKTEE